MPVIQKHATGGNEGAVPRLQNGSNFACGYRWRFDCDGPRIHNGQVFIDAGGGGCLGQYRKTHLVTAAPLTPRLPAGNAFVSCKFDMFNLGLTICYDLASRSGRALAVEHGRMFNSSAWPFPRLEHL